MVNKTIAGRRATPLLIALLVAVSLFLWFGQAQASYADSGVYKNIKWEYNPGSTSILILKLQDTSASNHSLDFDVLGTPWLDYRNEIEVVQIEPQENGIDSISGSCFKNYKNLKEVYLGESVETITDYAFYGDKNLDYVYHPTGNCKVLDIYDEDSDDYYSKAFDACDNTILTFNVPEDSDLGDFAKRSGFMIENDNGKFYSLRGAEITDEKYYGISPWIVDDGYWAFTKVKWTGKALKPVPTVKLYGKYLKKGKDFTCKYEDNINTGLATVTVKGKGDYCDSIVTTFAIYPKGTSISKLTAGKKKLTVKWLKQDKKMSKKRIDGYQVQVATNKSFTKNKKTKTIWDYTKTSKTITGLKSNKTYYVRVRTIKDIGVNTDIYSTWSPVKSVKVK